ncbi:MAG: tetratricopeptide repeat protein [Deltaproteobacteria bacterium]|nr:tetratricopeptide repeat protein [Deltaproteobacteria bacterium]
MTIPRPQPLPHWVWLLLALVLAPGIGGVSAQERSSDPAAGRLLLEASRLQKSGETQAALKEYELLVERFPESQQAEEALFLLIQGRAAQGDRDGAETAARRLTGDYPRSPFAAAAYVLLAKMLTDNPKNPQDVEEARTTLHRVPLLFGRESYPRLDWRHRARVESGRLSLQLGEASRAAAAFVSAIEEETSSPWTSQARVGLAEILLAEGDWVAAADELQRVLLHNESGGHPEADSGAAADARRRLTLIHRLFLRPAAGRDRWLQARLLAVPGIVLKKPVGVSANDSGHLLIADRGTGTVIELGAGGAIKKRRQAKNPGRPWWSAEEAFLSDGADLRRMEDLWSKTFVARNGSKAEPVKEIASGERGAFGQWYLLDSKAKRVVVFVPKGSYLNTLASGDPVDLAQDSRGRMYVLDAKTNRVTRYSANGEVLGLAARGDWQKPVAVDVDAAGQIYVLDRAAARVDIFATDGSRLTSLGPQLPGGIALRNPLDLTVDGSGRLIIADNRLPGVVVLE